MDFSTWLTQWLARHPLREPTAPDRAGYIAEVMARVHTLTQPALHQSGAGPARRWLSWPGRLALAFATAAAGIVLVIGLRQAVGRQLAETITRESQMLAALDEEAFDQRLGGVESLAEELEAGDTIVLAEAEPSDDEAWVEQTLQVLDQLDDTLPDDRVDAPGTDESWLDELERLDQEELAARS